MSYVSYWLITAVFVHVTCILYDPQHVSAMEWRQQIDNAKSTMELIGILEPTATRAAQILDKIMGRSIAFRTLSRRTQTPELMLTTSCRSRSNESRFYLLCTKPTYSDGSRGNVEPILG